MRRKNWKRPAVVIFSLVMGFGFKGNCTGATQEAAGLGYNRIEETQDQTVIEITNQIAEIYPICPELLQAMIFYESSNKMSAKNGSCIGYMQVSTKWHSARAKKLGVSLQDGYGNILTGTDYLMELIQEHEDVATALMVYHGESDALEKAGRGELSSYAVRILDLSSRLEERNGKR